MKRKAVAIILTMIFIGVGVFGAFTLGFMGATENHTCPLALFSGTNCLVMDGTFAVLEHHISALNELTTVIMVSAFLLAFLVLFGKRKETLFSSDPKRQTLVFRQKYQQIIAQHFAPFRQMLRWIVLHNTQGIPSAFLRVEM